MAGERRSWRWAVAASRCRPTTAASTRSCSRSPGNGQAATGLASASSRRPAADDDWGVARFYGAFARSSEASHLALFWRTVEDVDAFLLDQDLVFIGGGNTVNMLAIWRQHGVDRALLAAWQAGVVMSGMSAGGVCWFEGFTTDSFGPELRAVRDGLGVLRGSFIPHYHGEAQRRPLYHRLVADGTLPGGYGVDDGAALVFRGTELSEVVSSQDGAAAYRVDRVDGAAQETRLPTRYLGD